MTPIDTLIASLRERGKRISDFSNHDRLVPMTRITWRHDRHTVACVYGYRVLNGEPVSLGYPDKIECWYIDKGIEPRAMTVDEILDAYA
jgi:hypothetical protein